YLYGIDLFNFAYWWECHEIFEGLWHAVGVDTEQGRCFRALIQLAAANLKRSVGNEPAAQRLFHSGLARLRLLSSPYMGIDIEALIHIVQGQLSQPGGPLIQLRLASF